MIHRIKAQSGIDGWRCRLQENYLSLETWEAYSEMYGLASRLEFKSAEVAWHLNPVVEGSVIPSDFRVAPKTSKLWKN